MVRRRGMLATATAAGLLARTARSQAFPSKQLRFPVGAAPSGGVDTAARVVGQEHTRRDGISVLVDNKSGGGGNIATRELLRALADGHTILLANIGVLAINPFAMKDVGYSTQDFAPITLAVDFSNVIVVHPSVPARSLAEYLALAKGPDGMTYGTSGVGSAGHLAGELLKSMSGARLARAPYRGGGPAMNDLVAGHVPSVIASAPTATRFVRDGRIRALAMFGPRRSPFDLDVPTVAELGFPGYAATNWYALIVASRRPPEYVAALNTLLTRALALPERCVAPSPSKAWRPCPARRSRRRLTSSAGAPSGRRSSPTVGCSWNRGSTARSRWSAGPWPDRTGPSWWPGCASHWGASG
ncbi:MAG: Bug family tripartite tricarboxylate transporter substrate binding protein [Reyranella sp.]|uniref:Bug family tripartite tricarboxylate transporter substrate binding protein n=1 Tax=Reyranella sp. TaxID=1929291 RepID=UPI003D130ED2